MKAMTNRCALLGVLAVVIAALPLSGASLAGAQAGSNSYNQTDAAFASMMLPHHEGGVELGKIAAEKGTNEDVRRLGRGIVETQTREAKTLRRMVKKFKTKPSVAPETEDRDKLDMSKLESASGVEFDRLWLDVISGHHSAAIQMAQFENRGGQNAAARRLARKIIAKQRSELGQFNELSEKLGG